MKLSIVILAAGQGTRMRSALPKVLQPLAGRPLLAHVVTTSHSLGADDICVVYGHGGDQVQAAFAGAKLRWALQAEQLGTGHAVMQAMPETPDDNLVLVLCGDVPLVRTDTLTALTDAAGSDALGLLTVDMDDPAGYGRIVRDASGRVQRIVEDKDAGAAEREIAEINTGVIACRKERLDGWLGQLSADNAQGEYYLTDVIEAAVRDGVAVNTVKATNPAEVMGINDRRQLAEAERAYQALAADSLMRDGATLADPSRVDVRGNVRVGQDVFIDVNTVLRR